MGKDAFLHLGPGEKQHGVSPPVHWQPSVSLDRPLSLSGPQLLHQYNRDGNAFSAGFAQGLAILWAKGIGESWHGWAFLNFQL